MKAAAIRKQLQDQIEYLNQAIDNARQDNLQNIEPLDDKMDAICKAISELDEEDAVQFESPMAEMIGKLEELAIELKAFQERMSKVN
jgi:hypothetical protein